MAGQSSWLLDTLQMLGKDGLVQPHYPTHPFEPAEEPEGHWEQEGYQKVAPESGLEPRLSMRQ